MSDLFRGLENLGFDRLEDINIYEVANQDNDGNKENRVARKISDQDCLYDKTYTCPVCENKFQESTIRKGKARLISTDTDFKPTYDTIDPTLYDVVLCPRCGYAALTRFFSKLTMSQKKWIKTKIMSKYKPREYPKVLDTDIAIERYKLALLNAVIKQAKPSEKAYICLKISWLYRVKKDEKSETTFVEHSYKGFKEAFENERFPICSMDEYTLRYLIGEQARRLGYYDEALRWFSKVILAPNINVRLKERARDQKNLIKELSKDNINDDPQ